MENPEGLFSCGGKIDKSRAKISNTRISSIG